MRVTVPTAARLLSEGNVVALPTETVYGLAASLTHPEAIGKIYSLKGRPSQNPLIIHLTDKSQLKLFVTDEPPFLKELVAAFWPGPLTVVLPISPETVPEMVRAGLPTAAFRVPDHPITRQVLQLTGPLVMPSANISGRPSATTAEHVEHDFGVELPVLDGIVQRGLESTVIRFEERWQIIRLGALPAEAFEPILGYLPAVIGPGEVAVCPGQLFRHYAPSARLVLTQEFQDSMQGTVLGFSDRQYPVGCQRFILGASDAPETVAENLYRTLRRLDEENIQQAFVDMRIPQEGLWITILERLTKASVK